MESSRLSRSLFPPSAEEAAALALHRCLRVLPHGQDTGGFFVALLRKRESAKMGSTKMGSAKIGIDPCAEALLAMEPPSSDLPAALTSDCTTALTEAPTEAAGAEAAGGEAHEDAAGVLPMPSPLHGCAGDEDDDEDVPAAKAKVSREVFCFFAFTPVDAEGEAMCQLKTFYGLSESFPWAQLFSSFSHSVSRRLYLTSPSAAALLATPNLRVLHAGVKLFEKDRSLGVGCPFRVVQVRHSALTLR